MFGVAFTLATQNLTAVLRVMQWGVIVLIFLFFLRVIRAVWVEVSPATIRKTRTERRLDRDAEHPDRPSGRRKALHLRVLEPEEREGQTFDLDDELTIGRASGCGVSTPDDIYT